MFGGAGKNEQMESRGGASYNRKGEPKEGKDFFV
jgi:hypothetical protein